MADTAQVKKAKALMNQINKQMKSDVIQMGSDKYFETTYIPTGVLPIDDLLGGGIPRGRLTTITGDFSTLKTYIALCAARECQRLGGTVAIIDTEHAYETAWADSIGIDTDSLMVLHPQTGEEAVDYMETMVRGGVDLLILDSVAATLPQQEQTKRLHQENIQPGRLAALMSAALRRLTAANKTKTAFLFINQLRENIGITFGPTAKATGGRAVPYYSSYILQLQKVGKINRKVKMYVGENYTEVNEQIGQKFKAELQKSKLSTPWREVRFDWSLTESEIDTLGFLINKGVDAGVIRFKGAQWSFGRLKVNGREKFKKELAKKARVDQSVLDPLYALLNTESLPPLPEPKPKKKSTRKKTIKKVKR